MAEAKTLNRSAGYLPYQATQACWSEGAHLGGHDRSASGVATGHPGGCLRCGPLAHPVTSAD
jgi:hypothetical protein